MDKLNYTSHELAARVGKAPKDFTKKDIIDFIISEGIRHINFQYPAGDGRLKTLNFVINDAAYLDEIPSTTVLTRKNIAFCPVRL